MGEPGVAPLRNGSVGLRMADAGPGGGEPREEVGESPGMEESEAVDIIDAERGRPVRVVVVVSMEMGCGLGDILWGWVWVGCKRWERQEGGRQVCKTPYIAGCI